MAIEIAIYETDALYDNVGHEPRDWAQKYIDHAIDGSGYTTEYLEPQTHPDPPYEIAYNHNKTPFGADPDDDGETEYLDGNDDYLDLWINARDWAPKAKDLNILLTNYDGQLGVGYETSSGVSYAVSEGGQHLADLTTVMDRGDGSVAADSMQTFLHETAHQIADPPQSGEPEHNMGMIYYANGFNYETPLGAQEDGWNYNECGDQYSDLSGASHRWDMRYSNCVKSNIDTN